MRAKCLLGPQSRRPSNPTLRMMAILMIPLRLRPRPHLHLHHLRLAILNQTMRLVRGRNAAGPRSGATTTSPKRSRRAVTGSQDSLGVRQPQVQIPIPTQNPTQTATTTVCPILTVPQGDLARERRSPGFRLRFNSCRCNNNFRCNNKCSNGVPRSPKALPTPVALSILME